MNKGEEKLEQVQSKENTSKEKSIHDAFSAGMGGGVHANRLAEKEKENSDENSSNNTFTAILAVIGILILVVIIVSLFF